MIMFIRKWCFYAYCQYKIRKCRSKKEKKILRMGALKMKLVYEKNSGTPFLMVGFCIELHPEVPDHELYGVDEDGFNGVMTAIIDGNGVVNLEPNLKVGWHEILYMGDVDDIDFVPYGRTIPTQDWVDSNSGLIDDGSRDGVMNVGGVVL